MKRLLTIHLIIFSLLYSLCHAQESVDAEKSIQQSIKNMIKGADLQDGSLISKGFWDNAALFATQGPDNIINVTAEQFANLHQEKKFGGQNRTYDIQNLVIEEAGIATATVIAQNDKVHYTYFLGLTRKENGWRIQTFLQHSEKKSP